MAAPGKNTSVEIIENTIIRETTVLRPEPPPPPPPPESQGGFDSRIRITTTENPVGSTLAMDAGNLTVRATISDEGARVRISSNEQIPSCGQMPSCERVCQQAPPPPPPPARTSSSTRFERRILVVGGTETVEEYENGRLVRKTINGKEQPLQ